MEPINVTITPVSIYGVLIHDSELKPKRKWLEEFFPDLVEESDKQGKLTDMLLYDWKQQLYDLADEVGLYILDKPGDCLDYYLGVIPCYPWHHDKTKMKIHTTKASAQQVIIDFLNKYFDLSREDLDKFNKTINYHDDVFMETKGE